MSLDAVLADIRACRACAGELTHTPRPVVRVSMATRLLICGQAPGRRVHESGLPFDDASGDRLRAWLGVDRSTFYDHPAIGVAAMAFCFPGTDPRGGDYPPPPRCAALWRARLLAQLPQVELTLLVGSYAQRWALNHKVGALADRQTGPTWAGGALRTRMDASMTETVAAWRDYGPDVLPLPHPSWRNTGWLRRNPWFEDEVTPYLRARVAAMLGA